MAKSLNTNPDSPIKTYGVQQFYRHPIERIEQEAVRERDDYEWAAYCSQIGGQIAKDFKPVDITEGGLARGRRLDLVVMTGTQYHKLLVETRVEAFNRGRERGTDDERRRLRAKLLEKAADQIAEVFL